MPILSMDLSGQLTFTNVPVILMMVAPASSDVPTAAPGRSSQPVARID